MLRFARARALDLPGHALTFGSGFAVADQIRSRAAKRSDRLDGCGAREMVEDGITLPLPGSGRTRERFTLLSEVAPAADSAITSCPASAASFERFDLGARARRA